MARPKVADAPSAKATPKTSSARPISSTGIATGSRATAE
jgi:hypothetical protein